MWLWGAGGLPKAKAWDSAGSGRQPSWRLNKNKTLEVIDNNAGQAGEAWAIIPVRSYAQAMDWSLVLISQGIESVIERDPDSGAWLLKLEPEQLVRGRATIRQYLRENRHRRWHQELPCTGLLFDGRSVFWFMALILIHSMVEAGLEGLRRAGRVDSVALARGEWWRCVTAVMLHADIPHLVANTSSGMVLLGFAMGAYGAGAALLGTLLAGAFGNVFAYGFHAHAYHGLGASGQVMGALGMLAVYSLFHRRQAPAGTLVWRAVLGALMLFVILGLNPGTDVLAHLGGFLGGILTGIALALWPRNHRNELAWDNTLLFCSLLVILGCWGMALRH